VTEHELSDEFRGTSVQVSALKLPPFLLAVQVTFPVGAAGVPLDVSVTSTVYVIDMSMYLAEEGGVTMVEVERDTPETEPGKKVRIGINRRTRI
jgi:hypothetical protein